MSKNNLEIIKDIIDVLDETERENLKNHYQEYGYLIRALDDTVFKFSCLSFHLATNRGDRLLKYNYTEFFLTSITNNSIVIKKLFLNGWHLQCQTVMRSQFEHICALLALLASDSFFEKFYKTIPIKEEEKLLTPRFIDSKTIIRKYVKKEKGKGFWNDLEKNMDELYDSLSKSSHGNLFQLSMLSQNLKKDGTLGYGLGGSENAMGKIIDDMINMNNFSQTIWILFKTIIFEVDSFEITDSHFELDFMNKALII